MMDLWTSLTKQEGEIVGELKPILSEPDLEKLRRNPFHITQSNIQVSPFPLHLRPCDI